MFVLGTKGDRLLSSRHSWRIYGQTVEKRSRYSSRWQQLRALGEGGAPTRRSLERAYERDAVSVAMELSAWAERPGVYHPEVSFQARFASELRQSVLTGTRTVNPNRSTCTETGAATPESQSSPQPSGNRAPLVDASAAGVTDCACEGSTLQARTGSCAQDVDDCTCRRSGSGAADSAASRGVSVVYYRRKRNPSDGFGSPLSSYMDRCIWCDGAGARQCPWCRGAGCRYVSAFPSYEEMNQLVERAQAGDAEARERLGNPSTVCRPCPVCQHKGMLTCKRCHGTGINHL
jgi:hypothetical protein